jgi:serpin B
VNKGRGFELEKDFTHTVNHYYRAYPQSRDFNDGETRGVINQWASDHTDGMIQEVVGESEFNPRAVSYLLNATYFKGMWSCPFEAENTIEEPFAGGEKVPMMHQELEAEYADNDFCQMVKLPYGNGTYNMQVFLPREGKTLDEVIENLNGKNWKMSGHACDVILSLPRFETDTDQDLIGVMSELGMPSAFNPYEADFSRMLVGDDDEDDYIGMMKQVAKIKLDEKGTEAAAVTVIEMTDGAPQTVVFNANRPFFYIISEQSTGVILFMGQYMGEGATGIEELMHNSQFIMHNDAIYNLQGQRIKALRKGLNIVDGKKVIVR